jgi:cytochrome c553
MCIKRFSPAENQNEQMLTMESDMKPTQSRRLIQTALSTGLPGLLCLGFAGAATAQTSAAGLAAAERFAVEHCAACHGPTGQSAAANFPRLAGQNEVYLVKQLKDFASGDRKSPMMKEKVQLMDDAMIGALATYYSRQQAAYSPSSDTQLMAVGQFVYQRGNAYAGLPACQSCHGDKALGSQQLPRLAGQHPAYIANQLRNFHQQQRSNDNVTMKFVTSRMSDLEVNAVAEYLGNLH